MGEAPNTAPEGSWQFKSEDESGVSTAVRDESVEVLPNATAIPPEGPEGSITWTASEFIAHQKTLLWYAALILGGVMVSAVVWWLMKDLISAIVVFVGALVLAYYGALQPKQLQYRLDQQGLTIGAKRYNYHDFRSFAIIPEGAFSSIVLSPLKRFLPLITVYYAPEDQDKILAMLSSKLPMEMRSKDLVDRLMWRLRF